jgi:hypothetical protein
MFGGSNRTIIKRRPREVTDGPGSDWHRRRWPFNEVGKDVIVVMAAGAATVAR